MSLRRMGKSENSSLRLASAGFGFHRRWRGRLLCHRRSATVAKGENG